MKNKESYLTEIAEGSKTCAHGKETYPGQKLCYCVLDKKLKSIKNKKVYTGELEVYFETGMECLELCFYDYRGNYLAPGLNNETGKYDGTEQEFRSVEWCIQFKTGQILKIYKEDKTIEWKGTLIKDVKKIAEKQYRYSFFPVGVDEKTWFGWFERKAKAKLYNKNFTNKKNKSTIKNKE